MKTLRLVIFITISFAYSNVKAQCNFNEDYTSSNGWTQEGNEVEILNGKVHFLNGAKCREFQKRLHKPLGRTLNENDCWEAKLEFTPTSVGLKNNLPYAGHVLLGLTAGTNSFHFDCPDPPCTGHRAADQDGILLIYVAQNPPTGDLLFIVTARDSINEYVSQPISSNPMGSTHYLKLTKTQKNQVLLSAYSDSSYTNHLPGSPISLSYPGSVNDLTHVQHGNTIRGELRRELTGTLDNLCLNWYAPLPSNGKLNLPTDTLICTGDSIILDVGEGSELNYLWSTGSTDSIITIKKEGMYYVSVSNACGKITDTINVLQKHALTHQLEDFTFCTNETAILSYEASDVSILWSTGETSSKIYPTKSGLYEVQVSNDCDTIYDKARVDFIDCTCYITLPNIFTPNNDGQNDHFKPIEISNACEISLSIFNRWGRLVFETTDTHFEWDGGDVADGVYFWIVDYKDATGNPYPIKKGTVTIIR